MKRPWIVQLQLVALGVIVLLVLYRMAAGPGRPDGLIVFSDLRAHQLRGETFVLDRPARLAIEAVGSFEGDVSDPADASLAAYGWILRRDDGQVAWRMRPERARVERRSLAHVQDTVLLEAGTYDVYFTSYGNDRGGRRGTSFLERLSGQQSWQHDARKWMLALRSADGKLNSLTRVGHEDAAPGGGQQVIWRSEPVRNGREVTYLFEVRRPTAVRVQAVGEIDHQPRDYGWIEDALSGERRWEMTLDNTEPAGGSAKNRQFIGEVSLRPGLYRAVFEADDSHAYGGWRANPPFNPRGWGMTLAASAPGAAQAVVPFDPWSSREPILSILRVPDDVKRSIEFAVDRPLPVTVYALGEIVHGERFDYGWLETEGGRVIWEMDGDKARHAGGHDKNREASGFLILEPGTYRLFYQTDDSHAYDGWNSDAPTHPERWGVALFPLASSAPDGAVRILRETSEGPDSQDWGGPPPPAPPKPPPLTDPHIAAAPGELLVKRTGVGNEANIVTTFKLPEASRVHIQATGEITPRGRFDYGWIERNDNGELVWEMTWDNTTPAGGDDRNRTFNGVIELPAGSYTVRFQSDLSHAYGDFGGRGPQHPEGWGILVRRLE